jgi:Helicase associated domain
MSTESNKRKSPESSVMDLLLDIKKDADVKCPDLSSKLYQLEVEISTLLAESQQSKKTALSPDDFSDDDDEEEEEKTTNQWKVMYNQLRGFRIENGHARVARDYAPNKKLGVWLHHQKVAHRNLKFHRKGSKMTPEQLAKMDALGVEWGKEFPSQPSWEDRFEEYKSFKSRWHFDPQVDSSPTPLGTWVSNQRNEFRRFIKGKRSLLTDSQIDSLNEMNFDWKGPRLA